ncbi:glycerate kinase [Parafrigoribacterium humi]|jgi:glycerate kinase|uniref:glycerate kinase n=1 Tax=Parafrigoribacterium humi TaxID=3144664 RepID=UPI0032EDA042
MHAPPGSTDARRMQQSGTVQLSIVIAPDSFKGSLPAREVAEAIADGWHSVRPDDTIRSIPQADGGEGTLDAIEAAVTGSVRRDAGLVTGPDGRPVRGEWLELPGRVAVVELAQMCGLPLMKALDPIGATTYGLGQVIRAALASGARRLVIGLGGSASTDGGAGALAALGLAAQGGELRAGGLGSIVTLDRSRLLAPPEDVVLLSDVTNPLLGQNGAAAVYGPQKGARPDQVESLDAALARFSGLLGGDPAQPGAGAAGGTAYGFSTAWGATIEPGAAYLSTLTGLPDAVARADLLLTGEGRFDATSAEGKLVGQLIGLAGEHGVAAGVIAGQLAVPPVDADGEPLWAASLAELAGTTEAAMADPARWLRVAGAEAARAVPLAE